MMQRRRTKAKKRRRMTNPPIVMTMKVSRAKTSKMKTISLAYGEKMHEARVTMRTKFLKILTIVTRC